MRLHRCLRLLPLACAAALSASPGAAQGPPGRAPAMLRDFSNATQDLPVNLLPPSVLLSGGPLGKPSSGDAENLIGLPIDAGTTGTLPMSRGGTGLTLLGTGVQEFLGDPDGRIQAGWLASGAIPGSLGFDPVPDTRQVLPGTGLAGGGPLSGDVTLSLAPGAAVANLGFTPAPAIREIIAGTGLDGGGQLTDDVTLSLAPGAAADNLGFTPAASTITITAGTGLAGGGTLDDDVLLSLAPGAAIANLGYTPVPDTRQIVAGTGLTGGGLLSGTVTISIGSTVLTADSTHTVTGKTIDCDDNDCLNFPGADGGAGDVTGPASSTANEVALFDGTSGKVLRGGGILGSAAFTATSAYEVPLTFGAGLTRSTNTVSVNTAQNIARLSNLTTNGLLRTTGGDGTLQVDTTSYVVSGGPLGMPSSGNLANATGLPIAGISDLGPSVAPFLATPAGAVQASWLAPGAAQANLGFPPVPETRQIIAGAGLIGGGNWSADRTLAVDTLVVATLTAPQTLEQKTMITPVVMLPTSCDGLPSGAAYLDTSTAIVKGCLTELLLWDDGQTLLWDDGSTITGL